MNDGSGAGGVRCAMLRGGTSKGLFFLAEDLPTDPAECDDLLLRLMGSPDPRQIDGLGGATSVTSKVAVVSRSADPEADVDYLFLQVAVDAPTVSDQQSCGNLLAAVGPFAVERGLVAAGQAHTELRIRMLNTGEVATARFATPYGRPDYRGDVAISGVPGTSAGVSLTFTTPDESRALLPTGGPRDTVEGVEVTCVDAGMPVVVATAESFGLTGGESPEELAHPDLLRRVDALRTKAGALMGLGDVAAGPVPKTVLVSAPAAGGHVRARAFVPITPHPSLGVLAAISTVAGLRVPGSVAHYLSAGWPDCLDDPRIDVEHPAGHLRVEVVLDTATEADRPRLVGAGVVRTCRLLFDGTAYPRAGHLPRT